MSVADIARPEIRRLKAYVAAAQVEGMTRLNANESPESPWAHLDRSPLNRYPLVRPHALQARLAELYDVGAESVLATRGSTEAIDTLIRTFCRAYRDDIVVARPSFDMYKVYADIQGVALKEVSLDADRDFSLDFDRLLETADDNTKLIFICSPNNPTGSVVAIEDILRIVEERRDRSVVVVDEAYVEFADRASMVASTADYDNLVVLRTLSKAFALAGARCGALIACEEAVLMLSRVLSPYSFSTPVVERVMDAMTDEGFREAAALVQRAVTERQRVADALGRSAVVERIWPSQANFLFVRFADIDAVRGALREKRILIREFASLPDFAGCARITIGTPAENDALLDALEGIAA